MISPPAIRFKGTGWYVTDYADKKKPPETERAEAESSADKKTDSKKTDPKNEKKAS